MFNLLGIMYMTVNDRYGDCYFILLVIALAVDNDDVYDEKR